MHGVQGSCDIATRQNLPLTALAAKDSRSFVKQSRPFNTGSCPRADSRRACRPGAIISDSECPRHTFTRPRPTSLRSATLR